MEIKKKLAEEGIFIPTLWPNVMDEMPLDSIEYDYASNILPLPCDQRYSTNEMRIIVEKLKIL